MLMPYCSHTLTGPGAPSAWYPNSWAMFALAHEQQLYKGAPVELVHMAHEPSLVCHELQSAHGVVTIWTASKETTASCAA